MGSSTLGIGLTMFLRDQFSGPASRIRGSNKTLQAEMRRTQEENLRHQRNLYAGIALAGAAAIRGMARMVGEASKFGYEMEFVKSITSASNAEAAKLGALGMKLGQDTMFFAQDVAEGMRFMAMAGMSAQEVNKNIQGAVNLAGATKSLLGGKGGAADIMTNVMKQFKIDFAHTTDIADILSYAVTRSNTNLFDLGEALKYAGSTSMDLNISLQESTAMVMALGNAGMQGSMAGVAMENSMRYMTRAFSSFGSGTSLKALAVLGLGVSDVTDQAGNLLSMTEVMKKFGNTIAEVQGNVERQALLQAVFGVRGKRAASLFLRNLQEFDRFTGEISTKSGGHSARIMTDMMNTLQGQILRTGSAWKNMWIKFTQAVEPTVKWILNGFERLFTLFQKIAGTPVLGPMLTHGITGFIIIRTVASAFRAVQAGIRLLTLQTTGAMTSMASTTVAGYNAMTGAATRYSIAQKAGMMGYNPRAFRGTGGYFVNVTGGGYKQFKSASTAAKFARGSGFSRFGAAGATAAGMGLLRSGAGRGAGALFARAIGFLGGPLGIALSFGLPMAIGALTSIIRKNKSSTEENTSALNKRNENIKGGMRYGGEFVPNDIIGTRILALQGMYNPIVNANAVGSGFNSAVMEALNKLVDKAQSGDLIINLDGETIFKSPIDNLKKDFQSVGMY